MKTNKLLIACAMVMLLIGLGITPGVMAQERGAGSEAASEQFLVGSLGTSASATDVFGVLCPSGTASARADVNDNGGFDTVRLGVCITADGNPGHCRNAPDNGISVPAVALSGPGVYYVQIFKSLPPAPPLSVEAYDTIIDCYNSSGVPIAADSVLLIQNE